VKTERKWVYSILKDTTFGMDSKSNYCIKVDDNRYELLDSYKDYISGLISDYFGKTLHINIVKSSESFSSDSTAQQGMQEEKTKDNFELIKDILIKEFNAKIVR
jgi:hypothetical protein